MGTADLLAILDAGPLPHAFMTRPQREAMQAGVDALIDYLDAIEPDCDLEDDGTAEPYMSRPETGAGHQRDTSFGGDECEPDGDSEPSLGSQNPTITASGRLWLGFQRDLSQPYRTIEGSQRHWSHGGTRDHEEQNEDGDPLDDGEEDTTDREPSLGAAACINQAAWGAECTSVNGSLDLEHDPAEAGIGDMDGLCEQLAMWDGRIPHAIGGYVA